VKALVDGRIRPLAFDQEYWLRPFSHDEIDLAAVDIPEVAKI